MTLPHGDARIRTILAKVEQVAEHEREAILERLIAGEAAEVRETIRKAVRNHLDRSAPTGVPSDDTDATIAMPSVEAVGTQIGPYRLLSRIGEGGFGTVWLAERRRPYVQKVALKVVKPGMDSRAVLARFEQERQALAVMNHPNIAKVLDGGLTPTGRPYFAMEHVKGLPITRFCDDRKLPIRDRLHLFIQVCDAVQHAHGRGIIHRDLKPSNILVSADEQDRALVKVIDFGVAKALTSRMSDATIHTETGQMIGTVEYMSPEQADPDESDIDIRSDVYSLGIVLYELLTGSLPFTPEELRRGGFGEIRRIIREVSPPSPSTRLSTAASRDVEGASRIARQRGEQIDSLRRVLRRELEWIPLMAMRKERHLRYTTAHDLGQDIRNYLDGRPLIAAPESKLYRVRSFVRRHRRAVLPVMLIIAALLAGFAATFWQWRRAVANERVAMEATAAAILERDAAQKAREEAESQRVRAEDAARRVEVGAYIGHMQNARAWLELRRFDRLRERLDACPPALRGWEWGWLNRESDQSARTLTRSHGPINAITFTPDDRALIATHLAGNVDVYDLARTSPPIRFEAERSAMRRITTDSAASRLLLNAAGDGLSVVDRRTGDRVSAIRGTGRIKDNAAISPCGRFVLASDESGTLRLWGADDGRLIGTHNEHEQTMIRTIAFSADGTRAFSGDERGLGILRTVGDGSAMNPVLQHESEVTGAAFSPDGTMLVTGCFNSIVSLWDAASGELIARRDFQVGSIRRMEFQPGGDLLAILPSGETVHLLHHRDLNDALRLDGHSDFINAIAFDPQGRRLATASADRTVRIWDISTGRHEAEFLGHTMPVLAVAFDATGSRLASACEEGAIRIWEPNRTRTTIQFGSSSDPIRTLRVSPTDPLILTTDWEGGLHLRCGATGDVLSEMSGHERAVGAVDFTPDGALVVTGDDQGRIIIRDVARRTELLRIDAHDDPLERLSVSPNGTIVASLCLRGRLRLHRIDGTHVPLPDAAESEWNMMAWSPCSERLAAGDHEGDIYVIDFRNGVTSNRMSAHRGRVTALAFSSDGLLLASGGHDRTLRLWDPNTRSPRSEPLRHSAGLAGIIFTPDARFVAGSVTDGRVRFWKTATGTPSWTTTADIAFGLLGAQDLLIDEEGSRLFIHWPDGGVRIIEVTTGETLLEFNVNPDGRPALSIVIDSFEDELRSASPHIALGHDLTRLYTLSPDGTVRIFDSLTIAERSGDPR